MSVRASTSFGFDLLRCHVLQRAEDRSFARDRSPHCGELRFWSNRSNVLLQLRQAKIEQLRAGLCKHDVAGLQIAVRDALAMRLVQRVGDLDGVLQDLLNRQRAFHQTLH